MSNFHQIEDEAKDSPKQFDYSKCQMHFLLYQKGHFGKHKINLYVENNQLILTEKAYDKVPKKIINLEMKDLVKWNLERHEGKLHYTGFTLQIRKQNNEHYFDVQEEIEFFGDSVLLKQLKLHLQNKVFQSRFQDEYCIQSQIGKGYFARVFSARHRETHQKIAVKCFDKNRILDSTQGYASLFKEINVLKTVGNHPNLIDIIGFYEGETAYYIAMSIFEGTSLHQLIKFRTEDFSQATIKIIMKQILEGIKHYSSFKIIHRDIKPENIMFRTQQSIEGLAVVDFGLAEFETETNLLYTRCGTPGYIAPEISNYSRGSGSFYSSKSDIFSLGAVFHLLYYSYPLFAGSTLNQVLSLNKKCEFNFEKQLYSKTPSTHLEFLKGLIAVKPEDRFSAEEALNHPYFLEDDKTVSKEHSFEMTVKVAAADLPKQQDQPEKEQFDKVLHSFSDSQEIISSMIHNKHLMFDHKGVLQSPHRLSTSNSLNLNIHNSSVISKCSDNNTGSVQSPYTDSLSSSKQLNGKTSFFFSSPIINSNHNIVSLSQGASENTPSPQCLNNQKMPSPYLQKSSSFQSHSCGSAPKSENIINLEAKVKELIQVKEEEDDEMESSGLYQSKKNGNQLNQRIIHNNNTRKIDCLEHIHQKVDDLLKLNLDYVEENGSRELNTYTNLNTKKIELTLQISPAQVKANQGQTVN